MHRNAPPLPIAVLLAALTAFLLAGCGLLAVPTPPPDGGGGSDPGIGGKPGGGGGGLVVPAPNDGALRELPDPGIVDARPTGIDHWVIGPDGRTVVVYYWGGNQGCFGLRSVDVEARDGVPVITVNEGTRPQAVGKACTAEALLKSAVVTLEAPILRDATGGDPGAGEPFLPPQPVVVAPAAVVAANQNAHAVTGYSLAADGQALTVHYTGGREDCYALAEASVAPAADGVPVVTIREGTLPLVAACDDIGVAKAVTITLEARLLVDGSQE